MESQQIIYKFIIDSAFRIMGNEQHRLECNNTHDLVTTQAVKSIPNAYIYCISDNDTWYGFDLRTLYKLYINNKMKPISNPYTSRAVSTDEGTKILKKIEFLERLGFPIDCENTNYLKNLSESQKFKFYLESVFQKLYQLDYHVDSEWLLELPFDILKKLYTEVTDIWIHRIDIPKEIRKDIVKKGVIFAEPHVVNAMTNSEHNNKMLLKKVVKNLDRLITEGTNVDNRKLGATYFMIGFAIVSPKVATSYPFLLESAQAYEESD